MSQIPCQNCKIEFEGNWPSNWYTCNNCNFRVCVSCLNKHSGTHNASSGFKCSQCQFGNLQPGK